MKPMISKASAKINQRCKNHYGITHQNPHLSQLALALRLLYRRLLRMGGISKKWSLKKPKLLILYRILMSMNTHIMLVFLNRNHMQLIVMVIGKHQIRILHRVVTVV